MNIPDKEQSPASTNTIETSETTGSKVAGNRGKKLIILAVLVLAIGLGAALYLTSTSDNEKKQSTVQTSASSQHAVAGEEQGRGISFKKPNSLSINRNTGTDTASNQNFVEFTQSDDNIAVSVSTLLVQSSKYKTATGPSAGYRQALAESFKVETGAQYYITQLGLDVYAKTAFPENGVTVALSNAKPFTNANVTKDAWQFDVKTTDSSSLNPTQTGKFVYLLGKNTTYKFMITATDENWQKNASLYQEVLNSIKIDQ